MGSSFTLTPLASIAHIEMGQSPDSSTVQECGHGGAPFLQGNAEFGVAHPTPRFSCAAPMKMCRAGDILISVRAPVGAINIADRDYCIGRGLAAIRVPGMSPTVAAHMVSAAAPALRRVAQGTTFEAISKTDLASLVVMAPPLEDRETLGRVLDTLDTTIRQTEAIIEKLKQVKQGLLHDLLTRGIDANGELRPPQSQATHLYKDSPLGWIPKEWTVRRLDEYCVSVADGTHDSPKPADSGYPLITSKNLRSGQLDLTDSYLIGEVDYRAVRARSSVEPGDLLFGMIGTVGNPVIIEAGQDQIATKNVGLLRVGGDFGRGRFLREWLESTSVEKQLNEAMSGSTQRFIGLGTLRSLLVLEPDTNEMELIVSAAQLAAARIRTEFSTLSKLRVLKQGLMDDLLTGRVRVTPLLAAPTVL